MELPLEYRWLKAHKFEGLTPWYFIGSEEVEGLRREYQIETEQDLFPFARRQDNDDIAGFEIKNGTISSKIITVHLTWTTKRELKVYQNSKISTDIFEWLTKIVIPASKDWMTEADLADIKLRNS